MSKFKCSPACSGFTATSVTFMVMHKLKYARIVTSEVHHLKYIEMHTIPTYDA